MKGFATIFKEVFSEGLEPYGFKKIKGRQPYIVRCINDEIVHVITYAPMWCTDRRYKEFYIAAGVATIYRERINLELTPRNNWWIDHIEDISKRHFHFRKERIGVATARYNPKDEESMYNAVRFALEKTKEIILPALEDAVTLKGAIEYVLRHDIISMEDASKYKEKGCYYESSEAMTVLKECKFEEYTELEKKYIVEYYDDNCYLLSKKRNEGILNDKEFEIELEKVRIRYEKNKKISEERDMQGFIRLTTDPEEVAWVKEELERRIKLNTEILKKHNII